MAIESMISITSKIAVGGVEVEPAQVFREKTDKVVSELGGLVQTMRRDINFHVDDVTGRVVIRVVETSTNKVVRQIPETEVFALALHLEGMLMGMPRGVLVVSEA